MKPILLHNFNDKEYGKEIFHFLSSNQNDIIINYLINHLDKIDWYN